MSRLRVDDGTTCIVAHPSEELNGRFWTGSRLVKEVMMASLVVYRWQVDGWRESGVVRLGISHCDLSRGESLLSSINPLKRLDTHYKSM